VTLAISDPALKQQVSDRAEVLRQQHQVALWTQTDRLFAGLLVLQWLACIFLAVWLSPFAWRGLDRYVHPHIWMAVGIGGLVTALPVWLAIFQPAQTSTRMTIAVAQMLHSSLLIHLSGGRLETHFHVFGSLAFLSFYRDWRVLIPATIVVAIDHAWRGIFLPESVFGLVSATDYRWVEHAGWVVFEDIFLVWSCIRSARELQMLATRQAELETSNEQVTCEVARQTVRLEQASIDLMQSARRAGMAEIAIGVLHNVGNVLNTVNVSATVVSRTLRNSEIPNLAKVAQMIQDNRDNLAEFVTRDPRGKHVPDFIIEAAQCLKQQQIEILAEMQLLESGVDHIKQIITSQQQHAKVGVIREKVTPSKLCDEAIEMARGSWRVGDNILVERKYDASDPCALDKHRVLQILINLLSNAKKSVVASSRPDPAIVVSVRTAHDSASKVRAIFEVFDNGIGIAPENLGRIFLHGFTTWTDGHGFGLHSAANAAREMRGELTVASEGPGLGSTFTLKVPAEMLSDFEQMVTRKKVA
jgi:signal transduction histidine kinase